MEYTPEQIAKVREILNDPDLLALMVETMEQEARDESDAMHAWAAAVTDCRTYGEADLDAAYNEGYDDALSDIEESAPLF